MVSRRWILSINYQSHRKRLAETHYWLRLLRESKYLTDKLANSLIADCDEIQRMLTASIRTSKANLGKQNRPVS